MEILWDCTYPLSASINFSVNANFSDQNSCNLNICWLFLLLLEGHLFSSVQTTTLIQIHIIWSLGIWSMLSPPGSALPVGVGYACAFHIFYFISFLANKRTRLSLNSYTVEWSYSAFPSSWLCLWRIANILIVLHLWKVCPSCWLSGCCQWQESLQVLSCFLLGNIFLLQVPEIFFFLWFWLNLSKLSLENFLSFISFSVVVSSGDKFMLYKSDNLKFGGIGGGVYLWIFRGGEVWALDLNCWILAEWNR